MSEIIVIGGGAAGMAAAIRAARDGRNTVALLERQQRVGKKLLSTGNGRCNLTNTGADVSRYHGADPAFAAAALEKWPPAAVLAFFRELGLWTVEEHGGRVYPKSGHAASVLDVLRLGLEQPNIRVITGAAVRALRREKRGFSVAWDGGTLRGDRVAVACGGCAGGKVGGVRDGYRLLEGLGHSVTSLSPALTWLRTAPDYPRALKGIRVDAAVRLLCGEQTLAASRGDVLFTEQGVSGTAVFDLARAAGTEPGQKAVSLDLFPEEPQEALVYGLRERQRRWGNRPAATVLTGMVQSRVGQMLCRYARIGGNVTAGELDGAALGRLALALRDFRLPVTGTGDFDAAQVTAGGARTEEFDPRTLESRLCPGLYACGEVLDIDGDCGGFNLQWAWASGLLAGEGLCC
ncbi:MAG: aminoacetone oxidase family FAD-binding enzyme [Oscillospiraceae bacterium]|nr:aminoacetone oxidase family FAD-binding enzyme [Oscillospiraceae bacterium]